MNRENVHTSSILKNIKAVRILECAYPGFDDMRISLFADALKGYDTELVKYVIEQWVLTKEKPPTIAELVDNCKLIDGWEKLVQKSKFTLSEKDLSRFHH